MDSEVISLVTKGDRYTSSLIEPYRKNTNLNETALNILGQFACEKYLSDYEISKLNSESHKVAYKKDSEGINVLLDSGIIQDTEGIVANNKHGARNYALTEYGIYRLFLDRRDSFMENQSDVRKDRKSSPPQNALAFLDNNSDSALFEVFLYPYFKKETLLAIDPEILLELYKYLQSCCQSIARSILELTKYATEFYEKIFSWEKVPGEDGIPLLNHLERILNLRIDFFYIQKEDNIENPTITVYRPSAAPIKIELEKAKNMVSVNSTADSQFKLQYEVTHMDQNEMWVNKRIPSREAVIEIINYAEREIKPIIYRFVYRLASWATTDAAASKKFSFYFDILSKDDKFMSVVEKIHEEMHKDFEKGYGMLKST